MIQDGTSKGLDPRTSWRTFVSDFSRILDYYPPAFAGNPLNLLFLDEARPIRSTRDYLRMLDLPSLCEDRREYLLCEGRSWPFPVKSTTLCPDPYSVTDRLWDRFDVADSVIITQADIATLLESRAAAFDPDIVLLMVVDGLSYYDLDANCDALPCLVAGASITEVGFRSVIGKPSISKRLFAMGYQQQIGYTYFGVSSNDLTGAIYSAFGSSQVRTIRGFSECISDVQSLNMPRGYVQVTLEGLDRLCHDHRDEPPIEYMVRQIVGRFTSLIDCLATRGRTVLACLTADHGILWRDCYEGRWDVVADLQSADSRHPRYIDGGRLRHYLREVTCWGKAYSLLKAPYVTRPLRSTEWGVHGGVSAWESIVPLVLRELK